MKKDQKENKVRVASMPARKKLGDFGFGGGMSTHYQGSDSIRRLPDLSTVIGRQPAFTRG